MSLAVCADVGSTYTKVAVVDLAGGALVATASHPTTVDTDVLHGLDAAIAAAGIRPGTTTNTYGGGWALPRSPQVTIDADYVLAAAGLLAAEHPVAATQLLRDRLRSEHVILQ